VLNLDYPTIHPIYSNGHSSNASNAQIFHQSIPLHYSNTFKNKETIDFISIEIAKILYMCTKQQNPLANHAISMAHCRQHALNPSQPDNPENKKKQSNFIQTFKQTSS